MCIAPAGLAGVRAGGTGEVLSVAICGFAQRYYVQ